MSQEAAPDPAAVAEGGGPEHPRRETPTGARWHMSAGEARKAGEAREAGEAPRPAPWPGPFPSDRDFGPDFGPDELGGLDMEDGSAADDQGLRWAALLAAFINDMQAPLPAAPGGSVPPPGPTSERPGPTTD
ncbi:MULTISPECIES: hypothetical protein [unclassified Streptomyces]|uniref:hypothetical protein n=1 Tax=unclassified Streptomyces TaxID=2593676 RepID=UPI00093C4865|nr:hypothetical protein [Streptomyces sp. TSRI0281]OKI46549.1 hypothetical protein A6A29_27325 [Streptomyces sp. TSRI0281]